MSDKDRVLTESDLEEVLQPFVAAWLKVTLIATPLAIWKLGDILWWLLSHLRWAGR